MLTRKTASTLPLLCCQIVQPARLHTDAKTINANRHASVGEAQQVSQATLCCCSGAVLLQVH
jgi:hypothetical protein